MMSPISLVSNRSATHQAPSAPSASARYFGPSLGGRQVRLAVSGLVRVFPLNYAGTDITGTERDLAPINGVTAADRPALAVALAAVLDRDPAAVAGVARRLAERRGAAAQTLAFEVAARLQEEIEALEWVTAPQRVTSATATAPQWQEFAQRNADLAARLHRAAADA